jgi:hypothetical protein
MIDLKYLYYRIKSSKILLVQHRAIQIPLTYLFSPKQKAYTFFLVQI